MGIISRAGLRRALVAASAAAAIAVGCGDKGAGPEDGAGAGTGAQTGAFVDARDGQRYKTVEIGGQVWMAQNLNFKTDSSWCYDNADSNCAKYGRLYAWNAAATACPAGWKLPDTAEWDELAIFVGGVWDSIVREDGYVEIKGWLGAGNKLKAINGWKTVNGTDEYGFSALPAGGKFGQAANMFYYAGVVGYWWADVIKVYDPFGFAKAIYGIDEQYDYVSVGDINTYTNPTRGFSVRCIQN